MGPTERGRRPQGSTQRQSRSSTEQPSLASTDESSVASTDQSPQGGTEQRPPSSTGQRPRSSPDRPPIRRWESGALAHGVTDPFGQGPLPWLRGSEHYFGDTGQVVPWYVDLAPAPGATATDPVTGTTTDGATTEKATGTATETPTDTATETATEFPRPRTRPPHPHPHNKPTPATATATTGLRTADDVHRQIKGFTSTGAVAPGEVVDFHVTVDPPQEFSVDVYRIGHYGGDGAAKITTSPRLSGIVQPPPLTADRTVSCHHWWLSWRLQIPSYWNIGAYVAVLTTADGYRSHIPFTVRDSHPADLLLLLPDITWQAYNLYPEDGRTGASLYHAWDDDGRLLGENDAAMTVSFDRPYAGAGLPLHVGHAYDFIRWAERYGYDLAYADARDLHAGRIDPTRYRGLVFPGHDEYWSVPMRRTAELARDNGTSLVFLSANTLYWQVELSPSPAGIPDRLLTCRKRRGPGRSALWREADRAEQLLLGIQYAGRVPEPHPLVVRNADHWLWEATGAHEGDALEGLVAGEADRYFPRTALPEHQSRILLAHSPYRDGDGARRHQETSLYRAPSGALVFASGTFAWSPALDRPGHVDPRIQRATANLLDRICKRD